MSKIVVYIQLLGSFHHDSLRACKLIRDIGCQFMISGHVTFELDAETQGSDRFGAKLWTPAS